MGGPFPTEKSSPPHPPRIHPPAPPRIHPPAPPRARFNHWASERASVHPLFLFLFFFLCHVGWVGSLVGGGWAESGRPRWAAATPTRAPRLPRSSPPSRAPCAGRPAHSAPPLSTTSTATQPPHPHLVSERGPPRSPCPPPPPVAYTSSQRVACARTGTGIRPLPSAAAFSPPLLSLFGVRASPCWDCPLRPCRHRRRALPCPPPPHHPISYPLFFHLSTLPTTASTAAWPSARSLVFFCARHADRWVRTARRARAGAGGGACVGRGGADPAAVRCVSRERS